MALALGSCVCHQRFGVDPFGLPEHRAGDVDRIVKSELVDDLDRRVVAGSELVCEPHARRDFDIFGKPSDDFAKGPDLILGIAAGNQDIGGVPERLQTAFSRSAGYRILQFRQKRLWFGHPIRSMLRGQITYGSRRNKPALKYLDSEAHIETACDL